MQDSSMTAGSLTTFDWVLIALLALSTFLAFRRGIIKVLFSLGGLIAGILVASWNYTALAHTLGQWIVNEATARIVAFVVILAVVMVIFSLLAGLVRKAVSAVGLGILDRLLGAGFGIFRGVLLGVALMMAIAAFVPDAAFVRNSQLAPYLLRGAHAVALVVPEHFREQITAGATRLLRESPELSRPHTLTQHM